VPAALVPAYRLCARVAGRHYENFPVASRLLPAAMRPHIAAIYAFARTADDFADEGHRPAAERLALIDGWRAQLWACAEGREPGADPESALVFAALGHTIRACALPVQLLDDLLDAFRQDVMTTRYDTWADLLDYCRRSANPVGRLVLRVAGYGDAGLDRSSDALCTALQLTNFWQDLRVDWANGRLYLPLEEARAAGAAVERFDPDRLAPEWRRALSRAVARTRGQFDEGRSVCDAVRGRLRFELRATWLGGMTVLDRIDAGIPDEAGAGAGHVVPSTRHVRPSLSWVDVPGLLWRALAWRAR
jgi:phytoene synthase